MKPIILIGMKACGKSTIGRALSKVLSLRFIELDAEIEKRHHDKKKENLTCRQIAGKYHLDYFRKMENSALKKMCLTQIDRSFILSCGGGLPLNPENRKILKRLGTIIYLQTDKKLLLSRIKKDGKPSFFPIDKSPEEGLDIILKEREVIYKKTADITIIINSEDTPDIINKIRTAIAKYEN